MRTLGIDTSNYTTSVSIYDSVENKIYQSKKLLPVKEGEKGLRQSDAVFHHTNRLHGLIEDICNKAGNEFSAIGVSARPRNAEGSYMPCFLVGLNTALSISTLTDKPCLSFSHQCNHIASALFSAGKWDEMKNTNFIAFHVSGGTTEMLYVSPDENDFFKVDIIGKTLDLNAGQSIDRAGVMLGLPFPCGMYIEQLALKSDRIYSPKIYLDNGNCSLSGVENKCRAMIERNESKEDVARFCLDCVRVAVSGMTEYAKSLYGDIPVLYAGGVMSNSIIREDLTKKYNGIFAMPDFSCDNASGNAIMAYEKMKG